MIRPWKSYAPISDTNQGCDFKKTAHSFSNFNNWLYLRRMKQNKLQSNLIQRRITVLLALLFCLFISSVEYVSSAEPISKIEKQQQNADSNQNQTFLDVAVDAVVPFAVHVSQSVLYFIYEIIRFKGSIVLTESTRIFQPNQLVEILFERIISTKGP